MLSGMSSMTGSMFSFGGSPLTAGNPTPEEMEKAAQAVLYNKTVVFKDIDIHTYDLSNNKDVKAYASQLKLLYKGVQARTHVILHHEKRFVEGDNPRWLAHLEWAEYELKVKPNPVVGSAEDSKNGKESAKD